MNEKRKSNSVITTRVVDGKLEFTVLGAGVLVFDPDKASAENRSRAMKHGFFQRISDAGALSRNTENGKPASPQDKLARMRRMAEHYESGTAEWKLAVAATPKGPDAGIVVRALLALGKARDVDHGNALIGALAVARGIERDGAVKLLAAAKDIALKIAELRALDAAPEHDSDELLEGLMEGEGGPDDEEIEGVDEPADEVEGDS